MAKDKTPEADSQEETMEMAEAASQQAEDQAQAQDAAASASKRVRVKFFNGANEDGRDDVLLGLEGKVLRVKREEVVEIPEEYLHVADLAMQTLYDSKGNSRTVPRFPYQRM